MTGRKSVRYMLHFLQERVDLDQCELSKSRLCLHGEALMWINIFALKKKMHF